MFKIAGHDITPEQAAILLDDGLFRGVPCWGRVHKSRPPKFKTGVALPEHITVAWEVNNLLAGGEMEIRDETAMDSSNKDILWHFDLQAFERGLNLFAVNTPVMFQTIMAMFKAGLEKGVDLTKEGDKVIQLGLFGEIKYS